MPKLRVSSFAVSIDGFGAGPNQDLQHPIGVGGLALMEWFFETRTWKHMHGLEGGETGIDDNLAAEGLPGIGAWILGRNMFGPVRGPWPDDSWKGWWGDEPPYHTPVFVLTHHPRPPLAMKGGTEFRFVTGGIDLPALGYECAKHVAGIAPCTSFSASARPDRVVILSRLLRDEPVNPGGARCQTNRPEVNFRADSC